MPYPVLWSLKSGIVVFGMNPPTDRAIAAA
jgi:hypothetical protein